MSNDESSASNGGVDRETLEQTFARAHQDVMLGDKVFRLREPSRRVAREFRKLVIELEKRWNAAQESGDNAAAIDVQDEILDAVYQFSEEVAADRDYVESNATERQMLLTLRACRDLVSDPLASTAAQMAGEAPASRVKTRRRTGRKR